MSGNIDKITKLCTRIFLFFLLTIMIGCSSDSLIDELADGGSETGNPPSETELVGYAQKGPFTNGTEITVQLLEDFVPIETLVILETDEFGNYTSTPINIAGDYIELIADGFYFDEIAGSRSVAPLILKVWSDKQSARININVLTTLAKDRIATLIRAGMNFDNAAEQARAEVLDIFDIEDTSNTQFKVMNMMEDGDANGILMAVSAILMQAAHDIGGGASITYELEDLLRRIQNDISTDGILGDADLNTIIENATMTVNTDAVRTNMETQYPVYVIPPFEQYILGNLNIRWTSFDCAANGVSRVETEFYDVETGTIYEVPWPCDDTEGTAIGLNAGEYDRVTVNFLNEFGDILYSTETADISIIAGQTSTLDIDPGSFTTGGISIEWNDDCPDSKIVSIQATVYDSLENEIQTAGPWHCDDGSRAIGSIPDLTDGSVVLVYSDQIDNEICRAELTDIDVLSGETTNIGPLAIIPPDITQPLSGTIFRTGDTITFAGAGSDFQGNSLSGTGLVWASDLDGEIGTGETFDSASLSIGQHTITLKAIDNTYGSITTTIIVHVRTAGTTIYVGPSEIHTTIQAAVDAAAPYDRIIVRDGIYNENVDVSKELFIESENGYNETTVLAADSNDHVFSVTADYVKIEGFTVYASSDTGDISVAGIYLYGTEHCLVTNNHCGVDNTNRNDIGIYINRGGNNVISNNQCSFNEENGISVCNSSNNTIAGNICDSNIESGISITRLTSIATENNIVVNNTATNSQIGIALSYATRTIVSGNTCSLNNHPDYPGVPDELLRIGIKLCDSTETLCSNNICHENDWGINLSTNSTNNYIFNNTCNSNDIYGIQLANSADDNTVFNNTCNSDGDTGIITMLGINVDSDRNIISDNTCSFNHGGLYLENAAENIVSGNILSENLIGGMGFTFAPNCINNTITENIIISNPVGIHIPAGNNTLYLNTLDNYDVNISDPDNDGYINTWISPSEITYTYNGTVYTGFLGNYYSDHDLTDTNGDGVTDSMYDSGTEQEDPYPLAATADNYTF